MKKRTKILLASVVILLIAFLFFHRNESVLVNGMQIVATTPNGTITIKGRLWPVRTYSSGNWSRSSALTPRAMRWSGSLGLYDPGPSFGLGDRLLIEEGCQFFNSESEALRYLQNLSNFFGPITYNNSGLIVAYKVTEIPNGKPTRHLEIWQIYINDVRPKTLGGAIENNIKVSGGNIPDKATPRIAITGYPRDHVD